MLGSLMTNLGGHDMSTVLEAFHGIEDDRPTCFLGYTIKGYGLPFAGHKDNHAGLMNPEQMAEFQRQMGIADGQEWERFAGLEDRATELERTISSAPFADRRERRHVAPKVAVPERIEPPRSATASTQEGFGRILNDIARAHPELADRIVTTSPDVTVSTNLGPWVNRRGLLSLIHISEPTRPY